MDQIEAQVRLPKGAEPLTKYSRYYAAADNGEVVGIYLIIPSYEPRPGESCEALEANLTSHAVPCPDMRIPWAIPAGERRWLNDKRDLPGIDDGGCSQITVTYSTTKSVVLSAECNGYA